MDKISFKKKIVFLSIFLLIPDLNVRPYSKNFILTPPIEEHILSEIQKTGRSRVTINLMERWVDNSLSSLLTNQKSLKYNVIISGDLNSLRIENLRLLSFVKVEYIVNELINKNLLSSLEKLRPAYISLIFKRVPELFEIEELRNSKIREVTLILDNLSLSEFLSRIEELSDLRIGIKIMDKEAFSEICQKIQPGKITHLIYDSRILGTGEENLNILKNCKHRMIYEIPNKTYYNNFLQFLKSGIENLNIYYNQRPSREDIIYWIQKTDP